jgi:putative DNA primase/helicase
MTYPSASDWRRRSPAAKEIAVALGGTRTANGWICHCPVVDHGRKRGDIHPSLSVQDGNRRLLVYCHAGCDSRDVLDALRARALLGDGYSSDAQPRKLMRATPLDQRILEARTLWSAAVAPDNTPAESYLRNRGIALPIPASIRYATIDLASGSKLPLMIVAVQIADGSIVAVQRTYLTWSGEKTNVRLPRETTGVLDDGAVRLAPAAEILGLAEGVEDALASIQLAAGPCWASLGASRMHRVAIPANVRELHIFADDDDAGRNAAERAANCHTGFGRSVLLRFPPQGHKDWASVAESKIERRAA